MTRAVRPLPALLTLKEVLLRVVAELAAKVARVGANALFRNTCVYFSFVDTFSSFGVILPSLQCIHLLVVVLVDQNLLVDG